MKESKLKVLTLVGTRPEIIKLSRVIPLLDKHCDQILVHSGQNYDYELNEIFFDGLRIRKPDYFLDIKSKTSSQAISKVISKLDNLILKIQPDAFLTLGDTNTSLGVIAAKKNKVPIFHMEAGNRCFDMRVPEEVNRILVDHTSDINMPYSEIAREYLISEGIKKDHIIKTGSPMKEVINFYNKEINSSKILKQLGLKKSKYFIVSSHREENLDDNNNFNELFNLLNELDKKYKIPILVSTHPRLEKKIKNKKSMLSNNIIFSKPFSFSDYLSLMKNAKAVLSDSGTISEEASILNLNAINIRDTHERPEASEMGACILTGVNIKNVLNAVDYFENSSKKITHKIVKDYDEDNVSQIVLKTILSYTEHVNKYSWRKPS